MAILDEKIQGKIDELTDTVYDYSQNGNYDKSFDLLKKAWGLYPNPKENWNEAYNTAKYIFEDYMKLKKFTEAEEWLNQMVEHNNINHLSDGELEYYTGMYKFETGLLEEAYKMFREAVKQSGKDHYRYFSDEGSKKYLDFYKKQKKLEDKK